MVNIPSDLRKNKDKVIGNMDLRECICVFIAVSLAIGILYYFRVILQVKRIVILAFLAGLVTIPFLALGFKKINGMKLDDYMKAFINNNILSRPNRINKCPPNDKILKDKKYEITRCYKLKDKEELIKLREHLKEVLILTQYIKYGEDKYFVFRLDGKDIILDYQKRNVDAIDKLKKEIKEKSISLFKFKAKNKEEIEKVKAEKLEIKKQIKELNAEKKKLQKKKFNDIKNEVDIFEKLETTSIRQDDVKSIEEKFKNDTRKIYELNLFDKDKVSEYMDNNVSDRVIFINANENVDVFMFETDTMVEEAKNSIIDLLEVDTKIGLYECVRSVRGWNFYNHYRAINKIEDIL